MPESKNILVELAEVRERIDAIPGLIDSFINNPLPESIKASIIDLAVLAQSNAKQSMAE